MTDQPLKPCPFCGSETAPMPVRIAPTMVTVRCKPNMGGCDSESGVATTEYEAIAAWNKRADQSITGRADFGEPAVKHHERRELVNELTKIAREYGQTQQLRERIAHALPFDCDATDAPSVDDARAMGQQGGPADEAERIAFEAWMIGHNWMPPSVQWTGSIYGSAYRSAAEDGLFIDPEAVRTRMLWAAWRDRAALSKQQSVKIPANPAESQPPAGGFFVSPLDVILEPQRRPEQRS